MKKDNVIQDKSFKFAVRIVRMYKHLTENKKEYVLSKQVLRSGTSIGANIKESKNAQSDADFINKMNIALKEANETQYWIELLCMTEYILKTEYDSIMIDLEELIKLLTSIIKTCKEKRK